MAVALLTAGLFGGMAARFDDSWALPAYLVLTAALVALAFIDLATYLLPNRIVYPLTVSTVVLLAFGALADGDLDALRRGLLAGVIAFVMFFLLHLVSPRSMGFGDVKLSFTLGLALGLHQLGRHGAGPVPRVPLRRGDRPRADRHQGAGPRARPCPSGRSSPPAPSPRSSSGTAILDWYRGS